MTHCANGAVTVAASTSYFVEGCYYITNTGTADCNDVWGVSMAMTGDDSSSTSGAVGDLDAVERHRLAVDVANHTETDSGIE